MFCIMCGKKIPEGMRFCPFCGATIDLGEEITKPEENKEKANEHDILWENETSLKGRGFHSEKFEYAANKGNVVMSSPSDGLAPSAEEKKKADFNAEPEGIINMNARSRFKEYPSEDDNIAYDKRYYAGCNAENEEYLRLKRRKRKKIIILCICLAVMLAAAIVGTKLLIDYNNRPVLDVSRKISLDEAIYGNNGDGIINTDKIIAEIDTDQVLASLGIDRETATGKDLKKVAALDDFVQSIYFKVNKKKSLRNGDVVEVKICSMKDKKDVERDVKIKIEGLDKVKNIEIKGLMNPLTAREAAEMSDVLDAMVPAGGDKIKNPGRGINAEAYEGDSDDYGWDSMSFYAAYLATPRKRNRFNTEVVLVYKLKIKDYRDDDDVKNIITYEFVTCPLTRKSSIDNAYGENDFDYIGYGYNESEIVKYIRNKYKSEGYSIEKIKYDNDYEDNGYF